MVVGLGLSGGGVSGDVTINLDTGSTHFTTAIIAALGGGSVNNSNVTLAAGVGLDGGGTFTLNQGGDHVNITFTVSDGVVSGSSQIDVANTTNYSNINQYSDSKVKLKLDWPMV